MLTRYDNSITSVFQLGGSDERSATAALAFVLSRAPALRRGLLDAVLPAVPDISSQFRIHSERYGEDGGYTDVELAGDGWHVVIEAKVGLELPTTDQLGRYVGRFAKGSRAVLVSISSAPYAYATLRLPSEVGGVPVRHLTWADVRRLANEASRATSALHEKLWLAELVSHLEDYVGFDRSRDNNVYVVSLSRDPIRPGETHTWVDVVDKDRKYFHPVGQTWPVEPVNYIGFRFDGELQSIHHVDQWELCDDLPSLNAKWPAEKVTSFVYTLGPAIRPAKTMKSGSSMWSRRVTIAIDLLLDGRHASLLDAEAAHKKRIESGRSVIAMPASG